MKLRVGEVTVDLREVTLEGGDGEEIVFTTYMNVPGTYSIDVSGLTGTVAIEAPSPPEPTAAPEPPAPEPPAPAPPPEGDNRLFIAAIVTASVAAGLGGYYWVRRRRAKGKE